MAKHYLAMDVGGTNIIAGLVDEEGRVAARHRFPTRSSRSPEEVMEDMAAHLRELAALAPEGGKPEALAVGLPGWINQQAGILLKAPNMPGWVDVPMAEIMSRALHLPVCLENDTNLYALGEWLHGAGRGLDNLLVVTLGTGVGGGLILDGRLWNGSFASAVEIGHLPLGPGGALCGCGRRGCLETVASATGMSRLGRQWLAEGRPTGYDGPPEELTPKVMHSLAQKGDPLALAVFREAGEALGLVLSAIFNLLGIEGVVLGGGATGAFEFIRPSLWASLAARVIITEPENLKLLVSRLGEDAPLAGGAALLRENMYTRS
ncbi:MAG: ROK family protein [Candidatus Adiutrix sp.]|jgi:glucokinase|nr:ROK family protein [Candidatus Adiutrix sp.]